MWRVPNIVRNKLISFLHNKPNLILEINILNVNTTRYKLKDIKHRVHPTNIEITTNDLHIGVYFLDANTVIATHTFRGEDVTDQRLLADDIYNLIIEDHIGKITKGNGSISTRS